MLAADSGRARELGLLAKLGPQNGGAVEDDIFHRSLSIDENSLFEDPSSHDR
jgi:hypothetical protein